MRKPIAALAVLFLAAHLLYLPPTLEDIDSVNFALGVRDFDVSRHQPHPPGYPVFVALAKASAAGAAWLRVPAPEVRGLGALSATAGALLVPLLFALYLRLGAGAAAAWWGTAVAVCSPLVWFTSLRPLSDTTGLAFSAAAQALLLAAIGGATRPSPSLLLVSGAAVAGLAAGVRVQTVMLTGPLLVAALVWPGTGIPAAYRAAAVAAGALGAAAWALPLIVVSGGLGSYLEALGAQAGEDFAGVTMLWTTRQARVALDAVLYSFAWPWGSVPVGLGVLGVAAAGAVRAAGRARRMLVLLAIAYVPYAAFHLLFHETVTVRYALPLVLPVALLFAYGAAAFGRVALTALGAALVLYMLALDVPAARGFSTHGSPAFAAFDVAVRQASQRGAGVLAFHAGLRRVEEWERGRASVRTLAAPHGREWMQLVAHWRREPETPVAFVADPRRTDLLLFDPRARRLEMAARWTLPEMPFVGGVRPGDADVYTLSPPGWMLDRGWALSAEIGGVTARDGLGPAVEPSTAWVRRRPASALLLLGGRHLGTPRDSPARLTLSGDDGPLASWDVAPGFFLQRLELPAGSLAGEGYAPLRVSAVAADGSGRPVRVSLEQFDLQAPGVPMFAFDAGWGEPEYNPSVGRPWRWMSERATLWVNPVGHDVTLTIRGESPLRYFERPPTVRVTIAGREVGRLSPATDFVASVALPRALLEAAEGSVVLESDLWFSPAGAGAADSRHLALRVYAMEVR